MEESHFFGQAVQRTVDTQFLGIKVQNPFEWYMTHHSTEKILQMRSQTISAFPNYFPTVPLTSYKFAPDKRTSNNAQTSQYWRVGGKNKINNGMALKASRLFCVYSDHWSLCRAINSLSQKFIVDLIWVRLMRYYWFILASIGTITISEHFSEWTTLQTKLIISPLMTVYKNILS